MATRIVHHVGRFIDYRLNILGIRVWQRECRLIARRGNTWLPIGQAIDLPVSVPRNMDELKQHLEDEISVTACQFYIENSATDIAEILSGRKAFETAFEAETAD